MQISLKAPRGSHTKNHTNGVAPPDLESQIKSLRRYAHVLAGNSAEADDLVQETLKRALTYINGRKKIENPRAYLMTMLHNVRADLVKQRIRSGDPIRLSNDLPLASLPNQNDRVVCSEVAKAVARLPEEQRKVLLLVALEGMTYQDAATILGVPVGTVMSRLSRSRGALRRELGLGPDFDTESRVVQYTPGRSIAEASVLTSSLSPSP